METLTHRPARVRAALAALLFLAQGAANTASGQTQWQEQRVEAAFLYNFAKFVEWPNSAGAPGSDPFTFCLLGAAQLEGAVEESLAGKAINGHLLVVRQIGRAEEAPNCQVAFIGWDERKRLPAVFDALNGAAVLTVADFEQFASHGGMIQLIKEGNKFRFAVNVDAVNRHGLRVSSRLLQLAEVVHDSAAARGKP